MTRNYKIKHWFARQNLALLFIYFGLSLKQNLIFYLNFYSANENKTYLTGTKIKLTEQLKPTILNLPTPVAEGAGKTKEYNKKRILFYCSYSRCAWF